MKRFSILALFLAMPPAFADQAPPLPNQFHVYSVDGIQYLGSDFEGVAGAGGNVTMTNFSVALKDAKVDVSFHVGGNAILTEGKVYQGGLNVAGDISLHNVGVEGTVSGGGKIDARGGEAAGVVKAAGRISTSYFRAPRLIQGAAYTPFVDHAAIAAGLHAFSSAVATCGTTGQADIRNGVILFRGNGDLNVFNISTAQLASAWSVEFVGAPTDTFVINVRGQTAKFGDARVTLGEGVRSDNVLFNFVDARTLKLAQIDLWATVVAPNADTEFRNALLTGGLYVGNLKGNGQANLSHFVGDLCPCGVAPVVPSTSRGN